MSVSPVNTSPASAAAAQSASAASNSNNTVSLTQFMQLLTTEMSNQDPLQPMDPTQTMTQLAQFTGLQETGELVQNQGISTASALLGAQVTVPGVNGNAAVSGTVTGIDSSQVSGGGSPLLILSGSSQEYPITSISQVQPAAAASSSSTPSTSPSS
ncbi:MAG: flagellar hook capping FlgD N-terminal domain-containing protein [Opitutaceae bacterium]